VNTPEAVVRPKLTSPIAAVPHRLVSLSEDGTAAKHLVLASLAMSLPLFLVLVAPLPIWAGQPTPRPVIDSATPNLGWPAALVAVGFILFLCLPFHPYRLALRTLGRITVSTRLLVILTVLPGAIGVLTYPRFGSDVFDYAAYERLWVVYGENPLLGIVANHPGDWIAPFVGVPDRTPAYGPVWALLTWPIARLAGDSLAAEVAGYKLLSLAAYVSCCLLIWASVDQARRQRALILFAWSPFVVFEALGKLHNDSLVAVSLLATVWLASRGHAVRGVLALVVGALVKATALVAAPALAIRTWRQTGWRGLTVLAASGLIVSVMAYAPFWAGPQTLSPIWHQTSGLGWSLTTILTVLVSRNADEATATLIRVLLALTWAGVSVLIVVRGRVDGASGLAATTGWLLIAALLLLSGGVYGHYFVPVVALAAVAGDALLERVAVWLSLGGLAAYGVGALGWAFNPVWIGTLEYQVVGSLVLLGPATLATLLALFVRRVPRQVVSP
jgi:hypothetical protein